MEPPGDGDAVRLARYGTADDVPPQVVLRAGTLSAELDAGNLRHIRIGSVEVLRAISFIVRDAHWATYDPEITDLRIEESRDGFTLGYRAEVGDARQRFAYRARIEGRPDGVRFTAEGDAPTGFDTNRVGFVVLHPAAVAGGRVEIEHVDGRAVEGHFPDLIDPVQPLMDLRALTHEPAPGLRATCRMEGDAFEMEDQRNWGDASFKTYVRPLSRPWPYRIEPGEVLRQSVSLVIAGRVPSGATRGGAVRLTLGDRLGPAPALGLGFDPGEAEATGRVLPRLAAIRPRCLVCHLDPRRGHAATALERAVAVAAAIGAEPWLEAVIAEVEGFEAEIEALGRAVRAMGSPFRAVLLSPAPDLKSTTPGQPWPPAPPHDVFFRVARRSFPGVRLGGGMISTFTELNRKRPPLDDLDVVAFTTAALVHAADDVSVMQGLEALPAIARSAQAIADPLPIVVGPSAIGLRMNPYGAAPVPNPGNARRVMALNDPRQRGLLGAAWAVGYYAHLARAGVQAVVLGGTTGPFGAVHTPQRWPTPGYDAEGALYPVFHALKALAAFDGRTLHALEISLPDAVGGVAAERDGGIELLLANLTAAPQEIALPGPAERLALLDERNVERAMAEIEAFEPSTAPQTDRALTLAPYGLARVRIAGAREGGAPAQGRG